MNAKMISGMLAGLAMFGVGSVASAQDSCSGGWYDQGAYRYQSYDRSYGTYYDRNTYYDRHTYTDQHWNAYVDRHWNGGYGVHVAPYREQHSYVERHYVPHNYSGNYRRNRW